MVEFDHYSDTCMLASITDADTSETSIIFYSSTDPFIHRIKVLKYEKILYVSQRRLVNSTASPVVIIIVDATLTITTGMTTVSLS